MDWEHKSLNDELRAILPAEGVGSPEVGAALPPLYRIQLEQQCMVSGAGRALFTASKWTPDGELIEARHCWYEPDAELRADILRGWAQFDIDLANYVPPAAVELAPVGKAPDTLPALLINVTGAVTASNLPEFKATALAAIRSVNRDLRTDADFADADKAVKWCADVEAKLKAAKEHALSQTASIDELFKALDDIAAESKAVRLDLAKVIDRRKLEVKEQAVLAARRALDLHIEVANAELAPMRLLPVAADFAGAIRGLRSIDSMQNALATTLAEAKIAADSQARGMRVNIAHFAKTADNLQFLFADLGQIVHKAADDFEALVHNRIATHRANEARKEEERKFAAAARIAAAEQRAREQEAARFAAVQAEDARVAALAKQLEQEAAAALAPVPEPEPVTLTTDKDCLSVAPLAKCDGNHAGPKCADPECWNGDAPNSEPAINEPATLTLGAICARLGFNISGAFLADTLHVRPAATDKRPQLYTESQYQVICRQLLAHIGEVADLYAGQIA